MRGSRLDLLRVRRSSRRIQVCGQLRGNSRVKGSCILDVRAAHAFTPHHHLFSVYAREVQSVGNGVAVTALGPIGRIRTEVHHRSLRNSYGRTRQRDNRLLQFRLRKR